MIPAFTIPRLPKQEHRPTPDSPTTTEKFALESRLSALSLVIIENPLSDRSTVVQQQDSTAGSRNGSTVVQRQDSTSEMAGHRSHMNIIGKCQFDTESRLPRNAGETEKGKGRSTTDEESVGWLQFNDFSERNSTPGRNPFTGHLSHRNNNNGPRSRSLIIS